MDVNRTLRRVALALAAATAIAPVGVATAWNHHDDHHHAHGAALWASPTGSGSSCSRWAPCTLTTALSQAPPGGTVRALEGTYSGSVSVGGFTMVAPITSPVRLIGDDGAVIDATGDAFGIGIVGTASGSTVRGFTVKNAGDTGIVVTSGSTASVPAPTPPVSDVTIADNTLIDNGVNPSSPGWGIHLISATQSTVVDNRVHDNGGGIYLTDEVGPNHDNTVSGNKVRDNLLQCGIILAGHVPALNTVTLLPNGAGGVFDNLVTHNVVLRNGTTSQGGGILMGGGAPYAAVYSNVIRDNVSIGNGLAGVVIHQHGPADLNGNVIVGNRLSNDNVGGDPDYPPNVINFTVGILVASGPPASGAGPITGTVITRNRISHVQVGIWTLNAPTAQNTITHNRFAASVATPISAN
jgi:parallel beta-helix repeat protein